MGRHRQREVSLFVLTVVFAVVVFAQGGKSYDLQYKGMFGSEVDIVLSHSFPYLPVNVVVMALHAVLSKLLGSSSSGNIALVASR